MKKYQLKTPKINKTRQKKKDENLYKYFITAIVIFILYHLFIESHYLGSDYKSESCFYCMKKQICPNKESTEFRLNHRNETFDEWNKRHEDYREQLIEDLKSRGKDPDIELIDYDWLNEDNDID